MKRRSELKRSTPLKQGEPLARKSWMPRGKGFTRSGEDKAATRKAAAKKSWARPKPAASRPVRMLLDDRSFGRCEVGLVCLGVAVATDTAHRMGKQSGGVGPKNGHSNAAGNLIRACRADHDLIDRRDIPGAERLGLKIRHGVALPAEVPVHLHSHNGWVLLDDEGGLRPAPRAAWDRPDGLLPVIDVRECGEPDYVAIPDEVLSRYGHGGCGGYEWTEDFVVYCVCGPAALFVADLGGVSVGLIAARGLAECEVHPVSAAHPECGVCLLCGPCECELAGEWAREVAP